MLVERGEEQSLELRRNCVTSDELEPRVPVATRAVVLETDRHRGLVDSAELGAFLGQERTRQRMELEDRTALDEDPDVESRMADSLGIVPEQCSGELAIEHGRVGEHG